MIERFMEGRRDQSRKISNQELADVARSFLHA
jgi:hypothetical protein